MKLDAIIKNLNFELNKKTEKQNFPLDIFSVTVTF